MQHIPYDIWLHITTFLQSEEVKSLLDINSPLFNIAMNQRYRTVCIGSLKGTEAERSMKRLVDPEVTARVRTLVFKPSGELLKLISPVHSEVPDSQSASLARARWIPQKVRSRMDMPISDNLRSAMPPEKVAESLTKIMSQLTSLHSLQIEVYGTSHWPLSQDFKPIRDLFSIGWYTFRSSLRTLNLNIPIEDLALFLPSGIIENLEKLSIQIIRAAIGTSVTKLLLDIVYPFLKTHRHSLRSLTLESPERISLSPLLSELSLPRLSHMKFHLHEGEDEAGATDLYNFFKHNREHLACLEIEVYRSSTYSNANGPIDVFAQRCFLLPMKRVERLHLNYSFPDLDGEHRDSLIRYIHQFKSTLRLFTLYPIPLRLDTLKKITEGFASGSQLRSMDLAIWKLDPELLATLAANVPNLETLCLEFQIIAPIIMPLHGSQHFKLLFVEEINRSMLSQWCLQVLDIYTRRDIMGLSLDSSTCQVGLLDALPNVKTFRGLSREEYLAAGRFVEIRDSIYSQPTIIF